MTKGHVAQTAERGAAAGEFLASSIRDALGTADALVVFAAPDQDHEALLRVLQDQCGTSTIVGCTSAGEFTSEGAGVGMTCVLALQSQDMQFTASLGRALREDRASAAQQLVDGFRGLDAHTYQYRSALVLADALAGFTDDLIDQLTVRTGGVYRFFGGGAGDDARFEKTFVFYGTEVVADAAVALEVLSTKPIGVGVNHGWSPASERMRVTAAAGMTVGSLNAEPAAEIFAAHASATGQSFDRADPVPFFLHNVLGVESAAGYRLRVPLAVADDGAIACASNVPEGAASCIMATDAAAAADAAANATRAALAQLEGNAPAVALVFDCVATRLRLGAAFEDELSAVQQELGDVPFAGFNTYGQIAQAEGQFSGFHNCTAVVCVLPA